MVNALLDVFAVILFAAAVMSVVIHFSFVLSAVKHQVPWRHRGFQIAAINIALSLMYIGLILGDYI